MPQARLTPGKFTLALRQLHDQDRDLAYVLDNYGDPPMWQREPGFATLIHIILEQQVSLASARAAFNRLCEVVSPLTPTGLLDQDDASLKAIGFSRQKAGYARQLCWAILEGEIDLEKLAELNDETARAELTKLNGVGCWTADIYLLMALGRPDVWPMGDLALAVALQELKGLDARPDAEAITEIGEPWRPWRAVAARVLWHFYLSALSRDGS
jgi:DNA-3-methyladenine glycosylase II